MADEELSASRMGVDRGAVEFELMMAAIRGDVARGLSPAQIVFPRAAHLRVSASTIYRWIERGYAGMSSLELRRKCGYKRRSRAAGPKATAHGEARSFGAFMGLPEEERRRLRDGHRGGAQIRPAVPADIVPAALQVPARAAHARQGLRIDVGQARRA